MDVPILALVLIGLGILALGGFLAAGIKWVRGEKKQTSLELHQAIDTLIDKIRRLK